MQIFRNSDEKLQSFFSSFCTSQVFYVKYFNPFVSEPPVVTHADPFAFLPPVMSPVFNSKDNFII